MRVELVPNFVGGLMLCLTVRGWHVRLFVGKWFRLPWAFHRWGLYGFGVGPCSVNIWPPEPSR